MTQAELSSEAPVEDFARWTGKEEERTEAIAFAPVAAMAATLDLPRAPAEGDALPPGWQWLFFNPVVRRGELGADGHPRRGGFLPPIALPRRMWAGSRLQYLSDLAIGQPAVRRSRIEKVERKVGKRGELWFVTVRHVTRSGGVDCIIEEQDIVYREAAPAGVVAAPAAGEPAPAQSRWSSAVVPDTTLLFRYSALTFNGHRIHYDQAYARNEEAYPDLVVHGPLTATLLQQLARESHPGRRLTHFEFRGVSPLHVGSAFSLHADPADDGSLKMWARAAGGELAMSAVARLA